MREGESSRDYKTRDSWKKNDKRDRKYRIEELGCPRLRLDTRKKRFLRKNYKKEQWICDKNVYIVICNTSYRSTGGTELGKIFQPTMLKGSPSSP